MRPSLLSAFDQLLINNEEAISKTDNKNDSSMKVSCTCSQILFILPLEGEVSDILFQRRYYPTPFVTPMPSQQHAFMLALDRLNVDLHSLIKSNEMTENFTLQLQSISLSIIDYNNSTPLVTNLLGLDCPILPTQ